MVVRYVEMNSKDCFQRDTHLYGGRGLIVKLEIDSWEQQGDSWECWPGVMLSKDLFLQMLPTCLLCPLLLMC